MSGLEEQRPFLVPIGDTTAARVDLICFPHAGAGASTFMRWRPLLPSSIALFALHTPGREDRCLEPAPESIAAIVAAILREIPLSNDRPYVLFGHSLGAIVGFELARAVAQAGLPKPAVLIASSALPPHLKRLDPVISHLPDAVFLHEAARRYHGLPPEILADPALAAFIAPVLRCDIGLYEKYCFEPGVPLDCPIAAWGGTSDRKVPCHGLSGWRSHTTSSFRPRIFPGDHFYLQHVTAAVVRAVTEEAGLALRAPSELAGVL